MNIKVCGMREADNVSALCQLPIDYIGFIFFEKSPRFAENILIDETVESVPDTVKKTGVFVNADAFYISAMADKFKLDVLQLHGKEDPAFCKEIKQKLGLPVVKAFGVDEQFDFSVLDEYENACDFFLFDTKSPKHGGTGEKFNWDILKKYQSEKPVFLSGGITADDYADVLKTAENLPVHAIDINSRFEIAPALKDIDLIRKFVQRFKE